MKMHILVIGGAGYIGSHMCKYLSKNGFVPVVMDNLSRGHFQTVQWGPFYKGSMSDSDLLRQIFSKHPITAVFHFAAYAYVGESVTDPAIYYQNNVADTLNVLRVMIENKVKNFIFSSTCATFGEPVEIPISENHPQNPINPYGKTKLMVEHILKDFGDAYDLNHISLRYFNAAGADPEGQLGEDHNPETHLIPLILQTALGKRKAIQVFGTDYPTEDGTCIRDYIHIVDLAQAHLLALNRLLDGKGKDFYNLGNGKGYSVKQVIETSERVTGIKIPCEYVGRRAGDPAILIGSSEKAMRELNWKPKFGDLESIIETAWKWHREHPDGYSG